MQDIPIACSQTLLLLLNTNSLKVYCEAKPDSGNTLHTQMFASASLGTAPSIRDKKRDETGASFTGLHGSELMTF